MKKIIATLVILVAALSVNSCQVKLKPAPTPYDKTTRCVLMGDSITEIWYNTRGWFFNDNNLLSAGKGGETSSQMLARFDKDVIGHSPRACSILCGINDIAQNQGYISNEDITANIAAMAQKCKSAGIKCILCSTLPSNHIGWTDVVPNPAPIISDLNTRIKACAVSNGVEYLDYHSALAAPDGGLPANYTTDGVHVTDECYEILESMLLTKLAEVLGDE